MIKKITYNTTPGSGFYVMLYMKNIIEVMALKCKTLKR